MTVNLLQRKLSLLESAAAVSFEWISSCFVHLDCPRLTLVVCGDWSEARESRATLALMSLLICRWQSCRVAQSQHSMGIYFELCML